MKVKNGSEQSVQHRMSPLLGRMIAVLFLGGSSWLWHGCNSLPAAPQTTATVAVTMRATDMPASTPTSSPTVTPTITPPPTSRPTATATPDGRVLNPANQHLYLYVKEGKTWHEARDYCAERAGYLAAIQAPSENLFVYNLSSDNDQRGIWLGASDEAQEGKWEWVTGEPWTYSNWKKEPLQLPSQPDNQHQPQTSGENYLLMIWDQTWYDVTNGDYPYFVCEWEPAPS